MLDHNFPLFSTNRSRTFDFRNLALPPGATLTRADSTTCATYTSAAGLIVTVAANVPRWTWSGGALQGLLVEPSRTNSIIRSEAFDNAAWGKAGGGTGSAPVVTADHAVAPDGNSTAERIVFDCGAGVTGSDSSLLNATSFSVTMGDSYVSGSYVKGTAGEQLILRPGGDVAYILHTFTGGWDRMYQGGASAVTGNKAFSSGIRQAQLGTMNALVTCWYWGAQGEIGGTTPSSYIKTDGSAVTRAADVLTLAVPNGTYTAVIERVSGVTTLFGQAVTTGVYTVPTDVSPLRRVTLRRAG